MCKRTKKSISNEIESYNQPLVTFLFDGQLKVNTIYFETRWFQINAISNLLKFNCKNETNPQFLYNATVFLQVVFQRVI